MSELTFKLIAARERLEVAIANNFGYVGGCTIANNMLDELRSLEAECKIESPDDYLSYSDNY